MKYVYMHFSIQITDIRSLSYKLIITQNKPASKAYIELNID